MAETTTFEDYVLEWFKTKEPSVAKVTKLEARGYDMSGDTEAGFYASFDLDISWTDTAGNRRFGSIEGADLAELWMHVVGAWKPASLLESTAASAGLCPRCMHTAHEDVGECKACYCRSLTQH